MTFSNPLECYEFIGQLLVDTAPERWKWIRVEFVIIEMDDVCNELIEYMPHGFFQRKTKQFFVDDTSFAECFFALAKLTSTAEKGFFKKCTYQLNKDGSYKADFEY